MANPQYNTTDKFAQYLDRHLLLKILNYHEEQKTFPENELLQAKVNALSKTNMITYYQEVYQKLNNTEPQDVAQRKEELVETLKKLKSRPFLGLFEESRKEELEKIVSEGNWTVAYLEETLQAKSDDIDAIYELAKFNFECGQYVQASPLLRRFLDLTTDSQKQLSALWGKIASDLAMSNWTDVSDDFAKLETLIEAEANPLKQLQLRTWAAHWSLFSFFQISGKESFHCELLLGNDKYNQVVGIKAPWLLRYLAIGAVLTRTRVKELVDQVEQESHTYSDPITRFIYALYVKFDFVAAEKELALCGPVLEQDYFVAAANLKDKFLEAGKLAICEAYCKIHSTIDIGMMAEKLGKTNEESERWIVNLIRNSKLDAKIDSAKNQVVVTTQVPNVYQQLLDKTKALSIRAGVVANNLERIKAQSAK
eukprot:TRINITY_DN12942_c0_g1_i1.p1 TRINITY_DN12942_c0_g1~~TRINITY_DN12942_c0_g1_i1.p1  ORF type:complete len:438 (-),score=128.87 TRINITY_DN12942_c0_g1_i1:35-1306(-)